MTDDTQTDATPPPKPSGLKKVSPLGWAYIACVAVLIAVAVALAVTDDSGRGSTSEASVEAVDRQERTTTTEEPVDPEQVAADACMLEAQSVFDDMDAGYSATDVYIEHGGMRDAATQKFVQLYFQWQAWAMQSGREEALDQVYEQVDNYCSDNATAGDPYGCEPGYCDD
jgi:hypothetical protein